MKMNLKNRHHPQNLTHRVKYKKLMTILKVILLTIKIKMAAISKLEMEVFKESKLRILWLIVRSTQIMVMDTNCLMSQRIYLMLLLTT